MAISKAVPGRLVCFLAALIVAVVTIPTPSHAAASAVVLRAGSSNAKGDLTSDAVDKFAELVGQKTKGGVNVQVFYQTFGGDQQQLQSAQAGSIDMGVISNGNTGRFSDCYLTLDLPFVFKKYENLWSWMNGPIFAGMKEKFEKDTGLKLMFNFSFGVARDIQSRHKLLKTPADIKGLKIRTVSTPVELAIFRAWGANPTPIDYAQTYTSLQQGVVDGMEIHIPQILGDKFYEVVKYNIGVGYTASFMNLFMNRKKFESLSPEHQKALTDAASEAQAWHVKEAVSRVASTVTALEKAGMTMYKPTPDEWAQWVGVREKVWDEVASQQKGKVDLPLAKKIFESQ